MSFRYMSKLSKSPKIHIYTILNSHYTCLCESFTIDYSDTLSTLHYDHLPICCTCNLPITEPRNVYKSTYIKCIVKDWWDEADLLSYFNIAGSLRHEISVPVHSFQSLRSTAKGQLDVIHPKTSTYGRRISRLLVHQHGINCQTTLNTSA